MPSVKRGTFVDLGQHGELKENCFISEVIKWCTVPINVLLLSCSYKAVAKMPWGEETWSSVHEVCTWYRNYENKTLFLELQANEK